MCCPAVPRTPQSCGPLLQEHSAGDSSPMEEEGEEEGEGDEVESSAGSQWDSQATQPAAAEPAPAATGAAAAAPLPGQQPSAPLPQRPAPGQLDILLDALRQAGQGGPTSPPAQQTQAMAAAGSGAPAPAPPPAFGPQRSMPFSASQRLAGAQSLESAFTQLGSPRWAGRAPAASPGSRLGPRHAVHAELRRVQANRAMVPWAMAALPAAAGGGREAGAAEAVPFTTCMCCLV